MDDMKNLADVLQSSPGTQDWRDAVNALGMERLVHLLENDINLIVRCQAAAGLGYLRDKRAGPSLVNALKHSDWGVRNNAAKALGLLGDTAAIPALRTASMDSDGTVAMSAARAIDEIDKRAAASDSATA